MWNSREPLGSSLLSEEVAAAVWLTQILNQQSCYLKVFHLFLWWLKLLNRVHHVEQLLFSSLSFSREAFGYRHSYVNTVQSTRECVCVCSQRVRMWESTRRPFEVLHSLDAPLPRVSSLFEDHVAMIIKAAFFPLQTYGMNMDMIGHQASHVPTPSPPLPSRPVVRFDRPCRLAQSLLPMKLSSRDLRQEPSGEVMKWLAMQLQGDVAKLLSYFINTTCGRALFPWHHLSCSVYFVVCVNVF